MARIVGDADTDAIKKSMKSINIPFAIIFRQ